MLNKSKYLFWNKVLLTSVIVAMFIFISLVGYVFAYLNGVKLVYQILLGLLFGEVFCVFCLKIWKGSLSKRSKMLLAYLAGILIICLGWFLSYHSYQDRIPAFHRQEEYSQNL